MPHVDTPQSFCRGSVARRDITPPVGIYHRMWGAATHDRATGVHRPLVATALAVELDGDAPGADRGAAPQVIVGVDHCLLWNEEMDELRSAVCRAAGISPEQLQVAFSHTHAAGLMDPGREALPGGEMIAGYLVQMATRIGDAVSEALHSLRPVSIVYGTGRCALARQRDYWDEASGQFVCGFNPEGGGDDTVVVARLADQQGETVGTVVNYACHPTTLAWDNTLVSPDYVGAMRELIESSTGAPCLFLQGASGDLGPKQGYVGDVEVADRNGRELGYAALSALAALPDAGLRFEYTGPVVSGATLGTWSYRELPDDVLCQKHRWRSQRLHVDLPYRSDLPTRAETEAHLARWQMEEQAAAAQGDAARARDARAQVERMTRQLARLRSLPPGKSVPLSVSVLQLGDAYWVLLQGEHYNLLQRALRERFPDRPIVVATVSNGWRPGYVPSRETYGKGIYQESIAVVAPGSLEQTIAAIEHEIAACEAK